MKVIIATKNKRQNTFTCKESEIVRFGLFQTKSNISGNEITMFGITTGGETEEVIVVDMNITRDFYYDLLKDSVEKEFEVKVGDNGSFEVILTSRFKLNLNEMCDYLLRLANKTESGYYYLINGRNLVRSDEINTKAVVKDNRKSSTQKRKEIENG